MSEELDDLIAELADAVHDRATAFEWGVVTTTGRTDAAKQALRDYATAAERRGAERAIGAIDEDLARRIASAFQTLSDRLPYMDSELDAAEAVRRILLAALFPDETHGAHHAGGTNG